MAQSVQGSKIEARKRVQRLSEPSKGRGISPDLFTDRTQDGANAGRLSISNLEQALEAVFFREQRQNLSQCFLVGQLAGTPRTAQEVEESGILIGQASPCFRSPRVNNRVATDKLARQAQGAGGNFTTADRLRCEAQEVGCGNAGRENSLSPRSELLHDGRI